MIDDGPITLDDYHAMQAVDDGPITLDDLAAFEQPSINDYQIDSQPIHSDAAAFAMQPTPWSVAPNPVVERAPVVAGLPPTDPTAYSAYQRQQAGNRAGLAADAAAQQAITKGVPYADRLLAGVAGAAGSRINEAAGSWRDVLRFYTGGEATGQPAGVVDPRAVDELNAMGGTVGDTVGRGIIQNAPSVAELVPIDPVGMASMFLSHPLAKAISGSAGFSAAKAQFLTELEATAGRRAAQLTGAAIDDAVGGAAFGGVNAGARGENPITGAIEGGAAGAALGGVIRGVGAIAGKVRGTPTESVQPQADPRLIQQAVNEMRPGQAETPTQGPNAGRSPIPGESVRTSPESRPESDRIPADSGRTSLPDKSPSPETLDPAAIQAVPARTAALDQDARAQERGSIPSDRPSLESLATELGVPFTRRTRDVDLRRAVEAARSGPSSIQPSPASQTAPRASLDQPTETRGIYGEASETPPLEEANGARHASETSSVRPSPSLTPSPAEVEASQTTQSRLSQDPRYPRAQAGSDIRGIESTGESGIPLAREQESGPREAPTPIRTGDTDRTTQTTSSRDSGIDSSPNPTPRERQAWEMTREEMGGWDVRTNEPVALSPTVTVPLSELKQLPGYRRSAEAVQQRAEGFKAGTLKEEPLTVIPDREGGYFIDNGNHRFQLLQERGATSTQVRIKLGPDDSFAMRKDPTLGHRRLVEKALREGRPVPPEVLADYPDLKPATPKVADATPDVATPAPATPPPGESRSAGVAISRDERITSARKAMTAADREAMGLGAMDNPGRRGWEEALDTAREKGFNKKETALALAEDVNARPRAFDDVETAGLVEAANDLKNRHAELMQGVDKLTDRAEIFVRAAEIDRVETDFDNLTQALRKSGTEKGRALASQKLTLNADNQLVSVLNRAKVKKGAELSPAERAKFEDLTKRLEERSARVTELEKQIAETQAEQAVKRHAGRKRAMAPKAREAEYVSLLDKAKKLIAEGCD